MWCVADSSGVRHQPRAAASRASGRPGLLDAGSLGSFGAVVREGRHLWAGRARADSRLNFLVSGLAPGQIGLLSTHVSCREGRFERNSGITPL